MKPALDRTPEPTWLHWGVLGAMLIALTAGIAFTIGTARAEDSRMRAQLLSEARLAQSAVNWRRIQNLSGTEKDIVSPDYLRLKEQLTLMRAALPQCRFVHVMGRKPDGTVFFFVDSELSDSPDYSPPGQVFAEVSDTCQQVFVTGREVTEGPVADHLGTWVSAFIPVLDPATKKCIAVFCMDMAAQDWNRMIAKHCMMPIAMTVMIVLLLAAFIVLHSRALREKKYEAAAEAALQAFKDRYYALFEGSSDAVMILGDGRFMDCNTATLKMFGYDSKEEFSALHPADVSPPRQSEEVDSRTAADQHIAAALTHGIDRFEWTHRRRNGEDFPAEVWLTALQMGERRVLQATVRDITKRKQVEEERDIMRLRQGEINLLQQALLAPMPLDRKIKSITDGIVRVFGSDFCRIWLIRPGDLCEQGCIHAEVKEGPHVCRNRDRCLHLLASSGRYTHTDKGHRRVPFGCYKIGLIASGEEHKFITNDVQNDPRVHNHEWARDLGLVSFAGYQLQVPGGKTLGVLATFAKHPIAPAEDGMLDGLSSTVARIIQQADAEAALVSAAVEWRETFDAIHAYVAIIDSDHRVVQANRAFREAFPGRAVIGEHCFGLIHGAAEVPSSCVACAAFLTGKPVQVELQEPHLGNRWFDVSAFPLKDGTGAVTRIVHILRDITDRKRIETAMRESEERFRILSEHAPIGVSLVRPDMTYEYVNPFFTHMFGYSVADIIDRNTWYEKAYPDPIYRERVRTAWKADFAEHDGFLRMQAETFSVHCKDGTDKMIRVNGVVLPDNRVLMTHEDITQLVNAQKALRVAKDVAVAATETKSKFLANMSHEIRTPIHERHPWLRGYSERPG